MRPGNIVWFRTPPEPKRGRSGSVGERPEHIPGSWRVLDRAPGPGDWWLMPANQAAQSWATDHPDRLVSGCVQAAGKLLESGFVASLRE